MAAVDDVDELVSEDPPSVPEAVAVPALVVVEPALVAVVEPPAGVPVVEAVAVEEPATVLGSPVVDVEAADGWSVATRAGALRGSPWLPVMRISRLSSGMSFASSSVAKGGTPFR